jgi:hypothetical protein
MLPTSNADSRAQHTGANSAAQTEVPDESTGERVSTYALMLNYGRAFCTDTTATSSRASKSLSAAAGKALLRSLRKSVASADTSALDTSLHRRTVVMEAARVVGQHGTGE